MRTRTASVCGHGSANSAGAGNTVPRDVRELDEWIDKHPRLAWAVFIGIGVLVLELAALLKLLAEGHL